MKHATVITVLFLLSVAGCHKNSDPVSTPVTEITPAFKVDSLGITAKVQMDTIYHAEVTLIRMSLRYHFEGHPGTLLQMDLSSDQYGFTEFVNPAGPTPAETQMMKTDFFRDLDTHAGQDSILIHLGYRGVFWERTAKSDTTYGAFDIKDSLWVHIAR